MAETGASRATDAGRTPDAETARLLALMESSDQPAIWALEPEAARAIYDPMTAASAHEQEDIRTVSDIEPIAGLRMRVYRPQRDTILPVLLFYHGGGGVLGDLDTHDAMCRTLANAGAVAVVSVAYRLGPQHRFPAAFEDAWVAWEWLQDSGADSNFDTSRMAVGGDSAGAGLAAAVTQKAMSQNGAVPAFQLLLCPSLDATGNEARYASIAENGDGYFMTHELMAWFFKHYLPSGVDRSDPRLSPLLGELCGAPPPALIATAGLDPLRDHGAAYSDKLAAAGGKVTYRCFENTIHDFFSFGRFLSFAAPALCECAAVMRKGLEIDDTGNEDDE